MCVRHLEAEGLVSFFYDRGDKGVGVEYFFYEQTSLEAATTGLQCAATWPSFASLKVREDPEIGECEAAVYADIRVPQSHIRDLMDEWYEAVRGW